MSQIEVTQDCILRVKKISDSIATYIEQYCSNISMDANQLNVTTMSRHFKAEVESKNMENVSAGNIAGKIKRIAMTNKQLQQQMSAIKAEEYNAMGSIITENHSFHFIQFQQFCNHYKQVVVNHYTSNESGLNSNDLNLLYHDAETWLSFVGALKKTYCDAAYKKASLRIFGQINNDLYHSINKHQHLLFNVNDENTAPVMLMNNANANTPSVLMNANVVNHNSQVMELIDE
jgi:hypothetical protein